MKNVFKVLGIIALVAVIGFSMAACGGDDDGGGGGNTGPSALHATWTNTYNSATYTMTFKADGTFSSQGTTYPAPDGNYPYTVSGNTITILDENKDTGIKFTFSISADGNTLTIKDGMGFWQVGWNWRDTDYTKQPGGGGGGGDKRAELKGEWLKDGGSNYETIEYAGKDGDKIYFFDGIAGVTRYYGELMSYDGTTAKAGSSKDAYPPITFTATIAGNKLTVSGLAPIEVPGNDWIAGYTADFNGTYTKKP